MTLQPPILVVEDSEDHVLLLRHAFKKAGISNPVHVSPTGEDAIAYLDGTGASLIGTRSRSRAWCCWT